MTVFFAIVGVYALLAGLVGGYARRRAYQRCAHNSHDKCLHDFDMVMGGIFAPVAGLVFIGLRLASIDFASIKQRRRQRELDALQHEKLVAETEQAIAEIRRNIAVIRARETDEELKAAGLLDRLGPNPYDR